MKIFLVICNLFLYFHILVFAKVFKCFLLSDSVDVYEWTLRRFSRFLFIYFKES
jgi:hypothetical protein